MRSWLADNLSSAFGWIWCRLIRTRRTEMVTRLTARLGLSERAAIGMVDEVYRSLARGLAESLIIGSKRVTSMPVEVRGYRHMTELHRRGSGLIVVTVHQGNWELLTRLDYLCQIDGVFVSKKFRWGVFQRLLQLVRRNAIRSVEARGSAREMLRVLQDGKSVGFAIDQHANETGALQLEFLGSSAWVTSSPAKLARLAKVPIVPIRTYRESGRHVVEIHEPLRYLWSNRRGPDVEAVSRWYTKVAEAWVRSQPEQWLWLHRRWKVRKTQNRSLGREAKS